MYTHYSLFVGNKTAVDFAPIPDGGLPALFGEFHKIAYSRSRFPNPNPRNCIWPDLCIHPGGAQFSIEKFGVVLIFYTQNAVRDQYAELANEGNASAALALAAIS